MIELDNGFVKIENSDLFNISHFNTNAEAADDVARRTTAAEGNISDIQTALGTKVDTSTYTAGMATKVNSSTYTSGMAGKVDKVTGKGLSTEDYTTAEKNKLAGIANNANYYELPTASSSTLGGVILSDDFSQYNYKLVLNAYAVSSFISTVKKNGNVISSSLYDINDELLVFGGGGSPYALYSAFLQIAFCYKDETSIPADTKFNFKLSEHGIVGSGIVLGTNDVLYNNNFISDPDAFLRNNSFFACGNFYSSYVDHNLIVNITAPTKAIIIYFSGAGT